MNTFHNTLNRIIQNRWLWPALAVALLTATSYYQHPSLFRSPNSTIITAGFDGIKNYFTTAWHIKHDTTLLGYQGMNYPYGEHVLFTDNQPILVNIAQVLTKYFPGLKDQGVGVLNLFQLLSLYLSLFAFYALFRRVDLPYWLSAIVAFLLVLLTPQHHRWTGGHFGLSHAWVIPMLMLMLHTYEHQHNKRRISLRIGLFAFLVAQLHMYYFGLYALFLTSYHIVTFLRNPRNIRFYKRIVHYLLMIVLPYALLRFWLQASHFAADRPTNPYGLNAYRGYLEGIFLPYPEWPMYRWINEHITPIRQINGESLAYVGITATVFFLFFMLKGFRLFKREDMKTWKGQPTDRQFLRNIWWTSIVLGLFACGFPFAIPQFSWTADYLGPIKQFRSLGRFTWVLFTVFNLVAFYYIWHKAQQVQRKWITVLLITVPICFLAYEACMQQRYRRADHLVNYLTLPDPNTIPLDWLTKLSKDQYQAIIPLPYYNIGSENFGEDPDYEIFFHTQRTALASGVPDMGVHMSRTSISQTLQHVQITKEPVEMPRILHDFKSDKHLALLLMKKYEEEAKRKYKQLFHKASLQFENADVLLYQLPIDSLRLGVRTLLNETKTEIESHLVQSNVWTKYPEQAWFYRESYDSLRQVPSPMSGPGARVISLPDTNLLYNGNIPPGRYVLSFWLEASIDQSIFCNPHIIHYADRQELTKQIEGPRYYTKAIYDGWALIEVEFEVPTNANRTTIFISNEHLRLRTHLDELQIRQSGADVYYRDEQYMVKNNRWYVD